MAQVQKAWWKEAVVYQVYPRSFQDSDGDGVGDLNGIRRRLDYIRELGADVIWLCPIYRSPNDDNGYDISDYQSIMEEFGTLEEFEALLQEAHAKGLKIMLDIVVNHTSDEHAWFAESRSSRNNPKRDYYIWREGKDGGPPNNWGSYFSGSAWQHDEKTDMYYLHLFSSKQPDLNWENPALRGEVHRMMRWWLDKGVDGFRLDVINLISKQPGLPDGVVKPGRVYADAETTVPNGPRIHEFMRELNSEVFSRYDMFTVGETPNVTVEDAALYTGFDRKELSMLFQFEHMKLDRGAEGKWSEGSLSPLELKQCLFR